MFQNEYNRIDEARSARERYQSFLEGLPATTYNSNQEIYSAELARLDKEVEDALDALYKAQARATWEKEQVRQAAEIVADAEWLDSDFGTKFIISGGEVLELNGVRIPKKFIDAQMKRDEEDMPF